MLAHISSPLSLNLRVERQAYRSTAKCAHTRRKDGRAQSRRAMLRTEAHERSYPRVRLGLVCALTASALACSLSLGCQLGIGCCWRNRLLLLWPSVVVGHVVHGHEHSPLRLPLHRLRNRTGRDGCVGRRCVAGRAHHRRRTRVLAPVFNSVSNANTAVRMRHVMVCRTARVLVCTMSSLHTYTSGDTDNLHTPPSVMTPWFVNVTTKTSATTCCFR